MKKLFTLIVFILTINLSFAQLTFTPSSLDTAFCQHYYIQRLRTTGGLAPYHYTKLSGAFPVGVSIDSLSGIISGSVSYFSDTSFSVSIQSRDANNLKDTNNYTFNIANKYLTRLQMVHKWSQTQRPVYSDVYDTFFNSLPKIQTDGINTGSFSVETVGLDSINTDLYYTLFSGASINLNVVARDSLNTKGFSTTNITSTTVGGATSNNVPTSANDFGSISVEASTPTQTTVRIKIKGEAGEHIYWLVNYIITTR